MESEEGGASDITNGPLLASSPFRKYNRANVRFKVSYYTKWGENLMLCGSHPLFGNWVVKQGVWMTPHHQGDELIWQAVVSVGEGFSMKYRYCIVDQQLNVLKWEAAHVRSIEIPNSLLDGINVDVIDSWMDGSSPGVLLSRPAFRKVIFPDQETEAELQSTEHDSLQSQSILHADASVSENVMIRFQICYWGPKSTQRVFVSGSSSSLGSLNADNAFPLVRGPNHTWQAYAIIPRADLPIRYKYLVKDDDGSILLEEGEDLEIEEDSSARQPSSLILVSDGIFRGPLWRGAGLAVPVFSIRSEEDVGCGEFLDLKLLVDFAVRAGLRLVQLLPINDTSVTGTWRDSYPYSSLSVFALHPIYLRLSALSNKLPSFLLDEIEEEKVRLWGDHNVQGGTYEDVDYEATITTKLRIARKVYLLEKEDFLASAEFKTFFSENESWLKPYAAFCFLKDLFGTPDFTQWGYFSSFTEKKLEQLLNSPSVDFDAIGFRYYLQYHLHSQLLEASAYARRHHVLLKGDLPIGVARHSVDTWIAPSLFHMDTSTGAPPDQFDPRGQNWGFPTYNWEEMGKDGYAWWKARLTQLSKFFSAYRIDHILGFFRIWELPSHAVAGITGHFRPSIPVSAEEMEERGVWDFNRLSEPFISPKLLKELFGDRATEVVYRFLEEKSNGNYKFRAEFDTERKIKDGLQVLPGSPSWLREEYELFLSGLMTLITNVCLIRDVENPRKFYPRFDMEKTSSFADLEDHSKTVLKELYHDYYFVRQETLWRENGLKTLPVMINSSEMLTCGEDLGFVPACVPPVLQELGLLGLRIQRMPTTGTEFADPQDYHYLTVCAPSCHDCSTLRAWWEEDKGRRERFSRKLLEHSDTIPDECTPQVAQAILLQHCQSPSVWAIFPLQDLMALKAAYTTRPAKEETINDPTNPEHYWRYRVHITIETMLRDSQFISTIQRMLLDTGRACSQDFA